MPNIFTNTSTSNITLTNGKNDTGGQVVGSNRIKPTPPDNVATVLDGWSPTWKSGDPLYVQFKGKQGWIIGKGTVSGDGEEVPPDEEPIPPVVLFPESFILESPDGRRETYDRRTTPE